MASFMKARTLVNPGMTYETAKARYGHLSDWRKYVGKKSPKKKRKLSPLQKLFFGSKRQRTAAKASKKRSNPSIRESKKKWLKSGDESHKKLMGSLYKFHARRSKADRKGKGKEWAEKYYSKKRNPSRIMTISLNNPGTKRKKGTTQMAKTRKRRYTRRKKNSSYHRRQRNPVSYRKHTRRVYHRRSNRRNPSKASVMSGVGKFGGVLGGAALTHLVNGMLPATLTTGVIGYVTTALVATMQGKLVGSLLKKPALGKAMTTGGYFYLGLKVIADFFPSVGQYLPFGLKGMGILTPSNFYVPQVPVNGSMASFVAPAALPAAIPVAAGMRGINPTNMLSATRRTGRMR